jgi:hypothetical protein
MKQGKTKQSNKDKNVRAHITLRFLVWVFEIPTWEGIGRVSLGTLIP